MSKLDDLVKKLRSGADGIEGVDQYINEAQEFLKEKEREVHEVRKAASAKIEEIEDLHKTTAPRTRNLYMGIGFLVGAAAGFLVGAGLV